MEHTTEKGFGENLAWSSAYTDPKQPVKNWYDEIEDYDFNKPGFKSGIGEKNVVFQTFNIKYTMIKCKNVIYFLISFF